MRRKYLGFVILPEGEPPSDFRILPYGEVRFRWEGQPEMVFRLTPEHAREAVQMAAQGNTGGELRIDYEHRSETPIDNSPVPAAGWFNLEAREDGLYATNVRWTPKAAQMLTDREYRFFSPVFWEDGGFIRAVGSLALTNTPATVGQEPLLASAMQGDPMRERLIQLLGLAAEATDEQIEAALQERLAAGVQLQAAQGLLASAGITAAIGSDEAQGQALAAAANAQLAARVADLEAENQQLSSAQSDADATQVVEEAIAEGKIYAATRPFWLEQAKKNPKAVKAHFASLKAGAAVPNQTLKPAPAGGAADLGSELSEDERAVIAQTGITVEKYLATRQRVRGA